MKGLQTANQKEMLRSEGFEFVFTLFSQALEDRHFTKLSESVNRGSAFAQGYGATADDANGSQREF